MSLKYRVIPSILNGVSKQPPVLRASDQNEEELNTWSSMAFGLSKRPPTEYVAKLMDTVGDDAFVHYINRDTSERYCVIIADGQLRVFDIESGSEKTVNAPEGWGYLSDGNRFRAVTVADYTFIVNADRYCELAAAGVDQTADPTTYRWLNRSGADTVNVTEVMVRGLFGMTWPGSPQQYAPNAATGSYKGEVASIEKLPETATNGDLYKITGSVETGFVSYYVVRNGAVWDETVAPNQINAINAETMPHALVSEADGTFTFAPFSWAPRRVGDKDSNPPPTFVGRRISDVFFYQNRLGFLVDENIILSCTGDFGNFWRNTILDYIGTDVVDHAVSTTSISILQYAVPFNDGIMAFADQTQFAIENGEEGLTPESMSISPVTRYEMNTRARPVVAGTEVYFTGNQNGSSVVWEYTRIEQGDALNAAEISAHVPGYIPAQVRQLVSAGNLKALFAIEPNGGVFAYQWYWNGNEKIQSAWRKWGFTGEVIAGEFMDESLFLVVKRSDGVYLTRTNLEEGAKPSDVPRQVYLDHRVRLTGTYDPVGDTTTYTLPYDADTTLFELVRTSADPDKAASLVDPSTYTWFGNRTVVVPGEEETLIGGERYEMRLTFSQQFPQDYQGRPVSTGRLQLRTFTVNYVDTGFFRTEVSPYGSAGAPNVEEIVPALMGQFTGKIVGADSLKLTEPVDHTGSYSFQIYGDSRQCSITLSNDTHVGSTFVSAEWEGFYFNRASQ